MSSKWKPPLLYILILEFSIVSGGLNDYAILPLTNDPWQVFTADVEIDGEPF